MNGGKATWTTTQITLRRGQSRRGHQPVTIVPARVFENLEVISRATCPRDVELLSWVCPLVLTGNDQGNELVLIANVHTWHAALGVDPSASNPIRLRAVVIAAARADIETLAAELLGLDTGTRITSARGVIGHAMYSVLNPSGDRAKRGTLSTVAAQTGTSRQAIWAAADTDVRERLRRGRLIEEHAAPGFEAFAGMAPADRHESATRPPAPREQPQHREPRAPQPPRQQHAAEREARAREREARVARIRAAKLKRDATRLRQRAEKTAKAVERLEEQLREAKERLAHHRQAADEAARSAAQSEERAPSRT